MEAPSSDLARDVGSLIVRSAPPVTVWALTLNEWLAAASIAYIVLQAAFLIWRWRREAKRRPA